MADDTTNNTSDELSLFGRKAITLSFTIEGIFGLVCALVSLRRCLGMTKHRSGYVNFYTSLALADLGIAVLCPITAYASSIASSGWPFSATACNMYGFFALFCGTVCIWSLLMTAVEDQYIDKGSWFSSVLLALTWINALFWSSAPILGWGRYTPERYNAGCLYEMDVNDSNAFSFLIGYTAAALLIPIIILLFSVMPNRKVSSMHPCQRSILQGTFVGSDFPLSLLGTLWSRGIVVVVKQDVKAVPILMVASAPIAAKLSPIVNALVVAKTAPGMDSQKSKMK
ncbi:putative visual pigment-like receptor peropsin-like [Apostichopus japonicus]|uniref:Putative visual pigment-like receptor peropsin-like n=1 Tax=Stichopus japonicus TaxID=307972 RepID=A0A2G8LPG3_STIJA|nr:putative visual pigment-like receptor peropsin-like [Apostichopus japonicus]